MEMIGILNIKQKFNLFCLSKKGKGFAPSYKTLSINSNMAIYGKMDISSKGISLIELWAACSSSMHKHSILYYNAIDFFSLQVFIFPIMSFFTIKISNLSIYLAITPPHLFLSLVVTTFYLFLFPKLCIR